MITLPSEINKILVEHPEAIPEVTVVTPGFTNKCEVCETYNDRTSATYELSEDAVILETAHLDHPEALVDSGTVQLPVVGSWLLNLITFNNVTYANIFIAA